MLTALAALALQSAPALVPTPVPDAAAEAADARCIVVFGFIGSRGNPEQAEAGRIGAMYFVGKLRGRAPAIDLGRALASAIAEAKRTSMNAQAEGQRCGVELQAAGAALSAGGAAAAGRGVEPEPAPVPKK